eukprot:TRINITY_DN7395_c0_g1_i1.p2 TRINITY_DN7395_c0_g1~~TRINITY_DN7395_c0_g1_i1.p2  ORF type:complete len:208 (-),score=102.80 TRINITY_DN7395_c0_g1_i1:1213-1836(-)
MNRHNMNRIIMNYLETEGFKEAAEKFQEEASIEPEVNLNDMDERIKIRDAVIGGKISEATGLVHRLHPELLDDDRYLFFHLQQQQLIELIRDNRVEEALKFASEQLAERGEEDSSVLEELERTMGLLAFEDPSTSPFADLLTHSHRQKVASELNAAILKAQHAESTQPKLATVLKLLLWCQGELDKKNISSYPKMTDLVGGKIEEAK